MKFYNPVNDEDWIRVRDHLPYPLALRTVEELKDKAKELPWNSNKKQSEINNTVLNPRVKNVSLNPVTARPGTVAYLVRTFSIAIT